MTTNSQTPFLVFDCDPGCDDALAISLVLRANNYKQIEILTVAGNVGVDSATTNALRLVTIALSNNSKTSVKVFKGCGRSLTGWELPASNVHGRDGLGDIPESFLKKKGSQCSEKSKNACGPKDTANSQRTGTVRSPMHRTLDQSCNSIDFNG